MIQRQPRLHDPGYLAFVRTKPCCVCGKLGPSEACHIRMGNDSLGKRFVGMQEKPADRWSVPMCADHHRMQHSMSEFGFWFQVIINGGTDPCILAQKLYAEYGGTGGKPKPPRKIMARKPRDQRQKIQSRGFR